MIMLLVAITTSAQDIPLDTWRVHPSFRSLHAIAVTPDEVYGAATNGLLQLDRDDQSITTWTRLNGLSSSGLTALAYAASSQQVLIGYEDGRFDVLRDQNIQSYNPLASVALTGDRDVRAIYVSGTNAYLSTAYGVVVFDLTRNTIRETWRDLGVNGAALGMVQVAILGDSIFAATDQGILLASLNDNLLDFNSWKRFNTGVFNTRITGIAVWQGNVYAAISGKGIYQYQLGTWSATGPLTGLNFNSMSGGAALTVTAPSAVYVMTTPTVWTTYTDDLLHNPQAALAEDNTTVWVGDSNNGLLQHRASGWVRYLAAGPGSDDIFRMRDRGDALEVWYGGFDADGKAYNRAGSVDLFSQGTWTSRTVDVQDITDITSRSNVTYIASFGEGLTVSGATGNVQYNETNSTLIDADPPQGDIQVTATLATADGCWVTNYGTLTSLHFLKNDNTWRAFSFPYAAARYPVSLSVDAYGYIWMLLDADQGGGLIVLNPSTGQYSYRSEQTGSGALPSRAVRAMAADRDGNIWVGTDIGVAYFYDPAQDAVKPIYNNRFLLRDDQVTAIAVDGGNRKWLGTTRGVWLFDATGETLIHHFTTDNSPLPSNIIQYIAIHHATGEVFFATDRGLISYRSDATTGSPLVSDIKIFPNPVLRSFNGTVAISGLVTDATVKITDARGQLIWQTQASGGTASWQVQDYQGRRAGSGIYVVYAVSPDGSTTAVGKIAVVD